MTEAALQVAAPATFATSLQQAPEAPALSEGLQPTPQNQAAVQAALQEVDADKPETLVLWGANAQKRLGEVSAQLVGMTKSKDAGPVGAALNQLVLHIKGFDVGDIRPAEEQAHGWGKLFRKAVLPIAIATRRFDTVQNQVNIVVRNLDRHIGVLMRDMVGLERIYAENVRAYETVKIYIEAGNLLLKEVDEVRLPGLKAQIREDDPLSSERYAKLTRFRQRLERRVHDLVLTRTALFQGLPAVALIEDNDANLVERIQSTIANAVPLWHQRIALLLAERHGLDAAAGEHAANDLTNDLLEQTAKQLRTSSKAIRTEVERGIFDADKLKSANDEVVGALTDAIEIYNKAVERRRNDLVVAEQCEREMRRAMEGTRAIA